MGLSSGPFLVLVVALAVALPVLTVLAWPRLSARRAATVAGRVGLVVACQLSALLAAGVLVNHSFDFYSSWSDLLGRTGGVPLQAVGPGTGSASGSTMTGPPGDRPTDPVGTAGGQLQTITVRDSAGLSAPVQVYLPPQYFEPRYRAVRFPVVEILTGYPGHLSSLIRWMHWPAMQDAEVVAGRANPAVLAMLSPNLAMPRDTECADVPGGPPVETFLAGTVPQQIRARYRVTDRTGWGIAGYSTGGFCAVKLALRHPDVYQAAAGISGYYTAVLDHSTGALYGGSSRVRELNDPTWRVQHLPPPPVALLVTASRTESAYGPTRRFLAAARPHLPVAALFEPHGGHNFGTWRRVEPAVIDWLSGHLVAGRIA